MSTSSLPKNSFILYKNRPGRVAKVGDKKLEIILDGGERISVRPKDVTLLHPGPMESLNELRQEKGEIMTAWELLTGTSFELVELVELAYEEFSPSTAWAAWQFVADGLYFSGNPSSIRAHDQERVYKEKAARQAKAAEAEAWSAYLRRASAGHFAPEDKVYLQDVARLALGETEKSRVLKAMGQTESQENAHAWLLKTGYWPESTNPYPRRAGLITKSPTASLPDLEDEERRDLTHLLALAIDDEGSSDPDDALSIDGSRLWVHIADAAAIIHPDGPADLEARARGTNLYLPEGTITMLPQEATTRLGMGLAEISPALSFGIDLSPEGEVVDLEIMTSWVRVTRMTYGEAQAQINSPPLSELMEVAQKYEALRRDGGAIQIDLPEVRVRVMGDQVEIEPLPKLASRDLVREAMLMTGEAVARFALEHKIPIPYTSQNPPDHILEQAKSPSEMFALRRSMQASRQSSAPAPHAGLGMALYVQTTSPLRRYLDLVVHQQLRAFLKGREPLDAQAVMERVGSAGAIRGSARWAERLSKRFWTLIYLMRNPGWQGKGIVVDKRGGRDIVLIPDLALDTEMYLREKIALDSLISLALNEVNLAQMTTHFRRL